MVQVAAAYHNDPRQVEAILLSVAQAHIEIAKNPGPNVRLKDFGQSGVMYELLFWTYSAWRIEFIKSELRFVIFERFRQDNIEIPLNQYDLNLKAGWGDFADKLNNKNPNG